MTGEFYWRDDWYFKRQDDGSVRVQKRRPRDVVPDIELVIPAAEWASIVCSVSRLGEGNGRYDAACNFHGRQ